MRVLCVYIYIKGKKVYNQRNKLVHIYIYVKMKIYNIIIYYLNYVFSIFVSPLNDHRFLYFVYLFVYKTTVHLKKHMFLI